MTDLPVYTLVLGAEGPGRPLRDLLTEDEPLGPTLSDAIVRRSPAAFETLYVHDSSRDASASKNAVYVVGRKGAGKTTFIHGEALRSGAFTYAVSSNQIYSNLERFRREYDDQTGRITVDDLAVVWRTLLEHAAILALCNLPIASTTESMNVMWAYISDFGEPTTLRAPTLMARVLGEIREELLTAPTSVAFEDSCIAIHNEQATFAEAREALRHYLLHESDRPLNIVVDNLEDLNNNIDEHSFTLAALFRFVTTCDGMWGDEELPFRVRFAFPAELFKHIRRISSNPEKDFVSTRFISWHPRQLVQVAEHRLQCSLDVRPSTERSRVRLRDFLPEGHITTRLGAEEDALTHIMRHTQLLPRHLLSILNKVLARASRATRSEELARATPDDLLYGVREAEELIVAGILDAYKGTFPFIGDCLDSMKNHVDITMSVSDWHERFNWAGLARFDVDFHTFISAAVGIGALGVPREIDQDQQYQGAEFAYTFGKTLTPVEGKDALCVHPVFMTVLFDDRVVEEQAAKEMLPIYPYGTGEHELVGGARR